MKGKEKIFVDDIKKRKIIETLIRTIRQYNQYIGMECCIQNYARLGMKRWKRERTE